jgi:hypothetical protein
MSHYQMRRVISIATPQEREFQKARIQYRDIGGLKNFLEFRKRYQDLEETCFSAKK